MQKTPRLSIPNFNLGFKSNKSGVGKDGMNEKSKSPHVKDKMSSYNVWYDQEHTILAMNVSELLAKNVFYWSFQTHNCGGLVVEILSWIQVTWSQAAATLVCWNWWKKDRWIHTVANPSCVMQKRTGNCAHIQATSSSEWREYTHNVIQLFCKSISAFKGRMVHHAHMYCNFFLETILGALKLPLLAQSIVMCLLAALTACVRPG